MAGDGRSCKLSVRKLTSVLRGSCILLGSLVISGILTRGAALILPLIAVCSQICLNSANGHSVILGDGGTVSAQC